MKCSLVFLVFFSRKKANLETHITDIKLLGNRLRIKVISGLFLTPIWLVNTDLIKSSDVTVSLKIFFRETKLTEQKVSIYVNDHKVISPNGEAKTALKGYHYRATFPRGKTPIGRPNRQGREPRRR